MSLRRKPASTTNECVDFAPTGLLAAAAPGESSAIMKKLEDLEEKFMEMSHARNVAALDPWTRVDTQLEARKKNEREHHKKYQSQKGKPESGYQAFTQQPVVKSLKGHERKNLNAPLEFPDEESDTTELQHHVLGKIKELEDRMLGAPMHVEDVEDKWVRERARVESLKRMVAA
jgi:hypothetical protein